MVIPSCDSYHANLANTQLLVDEPAGCCTSPEDAKVTAFLALPRGKSSIRPLSANGDVALVSDWSAEMFAQVRGYVRGIYNRKGEVTLTIGMVSADTATNDRCGGYKAVYGKDNLLCEEAVSIAAVPAEDLSQVESPGKLAAVMEAAGYASIPDWRTDRRIGNVNNGGGGPQNSKVFLVYIMPSV